MRFNLQPGVGAAVLCAFITANVIVSGVGVWAQKLPTQCPNGGTCMSIYECPQLLSLLTSKFLTQSIVNTLRQAQCVPKGFNHKSSFVCCDSFTADTASRPSHNKRTYKGRPVQVTSPSQGMGNVIPTGHDCGVESTTRKIIGGAGVELDEFPWMAILEYERRELRETVKYSIAY